MHPPLTTLMWDTDQMVERVGDMQSIRASSTGGLCMRYIPWTDEGPAEYECTLVLARGDLAALMLNGQDVQAGEPPVVRLMLAPPDNPEVPQGFVFSKLKLKPVFHGVLTYAELTPGGEQLAMLRQARRWEELPFIQVEPPTAPEVPAGSREARVAEARAAEMAVVVGNRVELPMHLADGGGVVRVGLEMPDRGGWAPSSYPAARTLLSPFTFTADCVIGVAVAGAAVVYIVYLGGRGIVALVS